MKTFRNNKGQRLELLLPHDKTRWLKTGGTVSLKEKDIEGSKQIKRLIDQRFLVALEEASPK